MIDRIKGAIFDADGTMLDSMQVWHTVAADYLVSRARTPHPDLNDTLLGMGGHEIPLYFQNEYRLNDSVEDIQQGIHRLLEDFYYTKAPVKQGVIPVLEFLRARGIKMCVATATDRYLIEPALQRCGLLMYFERIFTCGEERTSKRSPEIYLKAAEYLGTEIAETLVFEDALYAVQSASIAGFPVVGVYDEHSDNDQEEIKRIGDYYVVTMDELLNIL